MKNKEGGSKKMEKWTAVKRLKTSLIAKKRLKQKLKLNELDLKRNKDKRLKKSVRNKKSKLKD